MSTNIRLATIGTSTIVDAFLTALPRVGGIELASVYSRDAQRAKAFGAEHGALSAYNDFDAMLADPEIDAVYVASPNSLHFEQSWAALLAGKHVIVEKPATLKASEWNELVSLAARQNVVVFEAMRPPYDPGYAKIQAMLPQIGTIRLASFEYCQYSARYDRVLAGERVNIFDPTLGGGALRDLGVYPLSVAVHLLGSPQAASAMVVPITTGADGAGIVTLAYESAVATASFSKISASQRASEIQGELGTLSWEPLQVPEHVTLKLHGEEPRTIDLGTDMSDPGMSRNMQYEIQRFVDLVRGADAASDHLRTATVLQIIDGVFA